MILALFIRRYLFEEERFLDGKLLGDDEQRFFLDLPNILDILSDLVMAFPSCATAIHRHHLHANDQALESLQHAIPGCTKPSPSIPAFLLHRVLPGICLVKKGDEGKDTKEEVKRKKHILLIVQKAGRLLTALCARPGEGRRRVVSEVAGALRCAPDVDTQANPIGPPHLWVLEAWAELTHALINPQAQTGVSTTSAPSLEMLRLMLDSCQMGEALTMALGRLDLTHPWATECVPAFLRPLEHLTRPAIVENLRKLRKKHLKPPGTLPALGLPRGRTSTDGSRGGLGSNTSRAESFHDNSMVDEAFAAAGGGQSDGQMVSLEDIVQDMVHGEGGEDEEDDHSADVEVTVYSQSDSGDSDDSDDDDGDDDDDDDDEAPASGAVAMETGGDADHDSVASSSDLSNISQEEEEEDVVEEGDEEEDLEDGDEEAERDESSPLLWGGGVTSIRDFQVVDHDDEEEDNAESYIEEIRFPGGSETTTIPIPGGRLQIARDDLGGRLDEIESSGWTPHHLMSRLIDYSMDSGSRAHQRLSDELLGELLVPSGLEIASMRHLMAGGGPVPSLSPMVHQHFSSLDRMYARRRHAGTRGASTREQGLSPSAVRLFPSGGAATSHELSPPTPHPLLAGAPVVVTEEMAGRRGPDPHSPAGVFGLPRRHAHNPILERNRRGHRLLDPLSDPPQELPTAVAARWTDDGIVPGTLAANLNTVGGALCDFLDPVPQPTPETQRVPSTTRAQPPLPQPTEAGAETKEPAAAADSEGQENAKAEGEEEEKKTEGTPHEAKDGDVGMADAEAPSSEPAAVAEAKTASPLGEVDTEIGKQSPTSEGETMANLVSPLTLSQSSQPALGSTEGDEKKIEEAVSTDQKPDKSIPEDSSMEVTKETADDPMMPVPEPDSKPAATEESKTSDETKPQEEDAKMPSQEPSSEAKGDGAQEEEESKPAEGETNTEEGGCPPGTDPEVWACLPEEMREELWAHHRQLEQESSSLVQGSGLDPEALAALPENLRQEVLEQEARERRMREEAAEAPANPANAQEMDNASFVASLSPELRREILTTCDDAFLQSLPPDIVAEANVLRERASRMLRGSGGMFQAALEARSRAESRGGAGAWPQPSTAFTFGPSMAPGSRARAESRGGPDAPFRFGPGVGRAGGPGSGLNRRDSRTGEAGRGGQRTNTIRLEPQFEEGECCSVAGNTLQSVLSLNYIGQALRSRRLSHRVLLNLASCRPNFRRAILTTLLALLAHDTQGARNAVRGAVAEPSTLETGGPRRALDFPPTQLLGTAVNASNRPMPLPLQTIANDGNSAEQNPTVVQRLLDLLWFLTKQSTHVQYDLLAPATESGQEEVGGSTRSQVEAILRLLGIPLYQRSAPCLSLLLHVVESTLQPLANYTPKLPDTKDEKEEEKEEGVQQESKMDIDEGAEEKKEEKDSSEAKEESKSEKSSNDKPHTKDIPTPVLSEDLIRQLCTVLGWESCSEGCADRVGSIILSLARVQANRPRLLSALGMVGQRLGDQALQELRGLHLNLQDAIHLSREQAEAAHHHRPRLPASALALPASSSEPRLLRVLQLLVRFGVQRGLGISEGPGGLRQEAERVIVGLGLESLWEALGQCLEVVSVLEGVQEEESDQPILPGTSSKNTASVAGLLARFLPSVEAFFTVNARDKKPKLKTAGGDKMPEDDDEGKEGGEEKKEGDTAAKKNAPKKARERSGSAGSRRNSLSEDVSPEIQLLVGFVRRHKALLNVLLRQNPALLERSLEVLVREPGCRAALDFDNKRAYFRAQLKRLRNSAARRHGTLRLSIRRNQVFEDSFHQLRMRTAEELRGRLNITFQGEEGIDAGGVTREWYSVLAREIFNANYALFIAAADGATFQPNPHSHYNPDHLAYFKFVGRILGKAIADGQLLDAHFTQSFYKHILNCPITHHDMEAIDPDYYKNLLQILEFPLEVLGLELTFSAETNKFGKMETVDLIENGRNIAVVDENKMEYVTLVTKHRMQTAIQNQIDAFLEGFHELVPADLISIFSPKELELLISGLPDINVNDLQQNTEYVHYKPSDPQIQWFWNVLRSFSQEEKALFLQFVTGSSKVPLEGFSMLQGMRGIQKFSIHKAYGGSKLLPASHTCFNQLDLPEYSSEEETREKILIALREGAEGFGFG